MGSGFEITEHPADQRTTVSKLQGHLDASQFLNIDASDEDAVKALAA